MESKNLCYQLKFLSLFPKPHLEENHTAGKNEGLIPIVLKRYVSDYE